MPIQGRLPCIVCHKLHGDALLAGIQGMGFKTIRQLETQMNNVLGVYISENVYGEQIHQTLLNDFGIEIGPHLGRCTAKSGILAPWFTTRVKIPCY